MDDEDVQMIEMIKPEAMQSKNSTPKYALEKE